MGPSGSGKTTLLNVLSSIDTISGGSVEVDGNEINKLSNKQLANFRKTTRIHFPRLQCVANSDR